MALSVPEISVVVPVYNEEDNLRVLAEEIAGVMARAKRSWEAVFVDDGSTDGSLAILRDLAERFPEIRYISLDANSGQSAAFAAGFREAAAGVIVTMDADLQNDPADIPAMLDRCGRDGVTMVVGWRAKRKDTWTKRLASRFGNAVRNRISRETIRDTGCSLKVMPRELLLRLPVFNGAHRFYPTLMRLEGAVIAEVAVNHRPRRAGVSKYGIWDRARKTALDLLAVRWLQSRHIAYRIKERSP
ncbi:MAG: glycosyltransferase family 2 protein [Deltaproteobacteria bacterium]|nr:glycosyltransferase family 2 protein [Deltaproteobacteria bacterium]